jgi:hypothetical protein
MTEGTGLGRLFGKLRMTAREIWVFMTTNESKVDIYL